ncbi:hypothetical protein FQA39_LY05441 [Lamprigera yunnana]|nr:hypothetical protein FQA39_LY05441 [Lamprigera yunnana]
MKPNSKIFVKILFVLILLISYCEWLVYYFILYQCKWPIFESGNDEQNVRAMILADTHLLGSRNGHWFDKLRREWQMYRTFQTAMTIHKPHVVFILGDITDEGEFCGEDEFNYYIKRFQSLFSVPSQTRMHLVVGNHDIGFHYKITPYLNQRFVNGFNSSGVQVITMKGTHFVLVNSMALEGDGCFLCKDTELQLSHIEKILKCLKGNKTCEKNNLKKYSRPILMTHFPLYRISDENCDEPDEAPFPLKTQKYREGIDCLGKGATYQLLKQIEPRLVLTGHSHHGCTRNLSILEGIEITLPSFSWRNKNNPSYGLFVFKSNDYVFFKCLMPRESTIICTYVLGLGCLFLFIIITIYKEKRKHKYKYH